jgi:phosphatidylglycerol:prolipoprotein diacylglycerol transferase
LSNSLASPDADIGFIAFDWLTMGQLLSLPMIVIGAAMMVYGYRRDGAAANTKRN